MTNETKNDIPPKTIVLTDENPVDKLKEITDKLEQGIKALFESERYKEYLSVMSKFHRYSFNNTILISIQKPDATLVMGFNAWKSKGIERSVKKGEKGIRIFAPAPYKIKKEVEEFDANGNSVKTEKEVTIPAFKVVSVFDISQTEGKDIPVIGTNILFGNVEQYEDFFAALENASPVPVAFEKIKGNSHGYYHLTEKRIAIDEGMSEIQTLKTLIHEIAHAKLHAIDLKATPEEKKKRVDRETQEVQAESIAYTVCQHYGLETSDYSFSYVAGWSRGRELTELKSSLETIQATAAEIIECVDAYFARIYAVLKLA